MIPSPMIGYPRLMIDSDVRISQSEGWDRDPGSWIHFVEIGLGITGVLHANRAKVQKLESLS